MIATGPSETLAELLISPLRNRRGFALVFVGLMAIVFFATLALAIDLGMLRTARAEAQRAADAAALAGASAYLDFIPAASAVDTADGRAMQYATENFIRNYQIQPSEVTVNVDPPNFQVTVTVRSVGLPLWFGSTFGPSYQEVSATATAEASAAGGVKCVKPFAIPDLWNEFTGEDADNDRRWGTTEGWDFDSGAGEFYRKWSASTPNDPVATGYGSQWRNAIGSAPPYDIGVTITIKSQRPGTNITSGFFYPWRIPGSTGANDYKDNITSCNPQVVEVGQPYSVEPGNMVGPTRQAINQVMATDPGAVWDQTSKTVINSAYSPNWQASPRVMIAGLFDPNLIAGIHGASQPIVFNDFALFFLEGFDPNWTGPNPQAPVLARFLGFANGSSEGATAGELTRILRLVK